MFKCTHCGEEYGTIYTEMDAHGNKTGKMLGIRVEEGDVCPRCGDGVLKPHTQGEAT